MSLVSGNKLAITRDADTLLLGEVSSGRCAQRAALMLPPPNKMGGKFLKRYLLHCFGAFLTALAVPAHAAAGYFVNGVCAIDSATAIPAFLSQFPQSANGVLVSVTSPIFDIGAGVIGANFYTTDISTGLSKFTWQTVHLDACVSAPTLLGSFPVQDVVFVFACVIIWAFGFQSGMHR
ncbi:MAG: hypothetical protein HOO97_05340 [Sideroxydans sp.]|nr:hypothetical protein [Sideroxydans sp.]